MALIIKRLTLLFFLLLSFSITIQAQDFSGKGSGTESEPYLVSTASELDEVRNFLDNDDVYFKQAANIDLGIDPYNTGDGWVPIGSETSADNNDAQNDLRFTGEYNGDGYKILNLFINRPTENNVGLFGVIGLGGVVENVHLRGVDVTGARGTGSLAGRIRGLSVDTRVELSSAEDGTVTGHAVTGGLVGGNNSFDTNPGPETRPFIRQSYAVINVFHQFHNLTDGGILEKYGGLVGCNQKGTTEDSFARGDVFIDNTSGEDLIRVGGLAGCADIRGLLIRTYSTGKVETSGNNVSDVGGLVGALSGQGDNEGDAVDSFWDTNTSGKNDSAGGTGKITSDMKDVATFTDTDTDTDGLDEPWDFVGDPNDDEGDEDIWDIDPEVNDGYPFLNNINIVEIEDIIFYSRENGDWSTVSTWSALSCDESPNQTEADNIPTNSDPVIICEDDEVSVSSSILTDASFTIN